MRYLSTILGSTVSKVTPNLELPNHPLRGGEGFIKCLACGHVHKSGIPTSCGPNLMKNLYIYSIQMPALLQLLDSEGLQASFKIVQKFD